MEQNEMKTTQIMLIIPAVTLATQKITFRVLPTGVNPMTFCTQVVRSRTKLLATRGSDNRQRTDNLPTYF